MITRFSTLYVGHIELEQCGLAGTPADDRRYPNAAADRGVRHRRRAGPRRRRAGLRDAVAGRAPLPARGLRVHPEHSDAGRRPRPSHRAREDRLRLQHRPHLASAPARRGLRHRGHPDPGPRRLRRRARLSHAARWRPSATRCWTPRPTASCSRSRWRSSSRRSARSRSRTRASTTRSRPDVPYRGYRLKEITLVPRPAAPAGRGVAADRERQRAEPRLHGAPRHQGRHLRHRGAVSSSAGSRDYQEAARRHGRALALGEDLILGFRMSHRRDRRSAPSSAPARTSRSTPSSWRRSACCATARST